MTKPRSPLGKYAPYLWQLEPVGGCNLRCWHCAARLQDAMARTRMIDADTWMAAMDIIRRVTPACRVEIAMSGEPTLHPDLPKLLRLGRQISPLSQFNIITNGTTLLNGSTSYRELFAAGANVLYVDMYAPREQHAALAEASGHKWFELVQSPATVAPGTPSPWTYYGPDTQFAVLAHPPERWPASARTRRRLGTWLGNLDWAAANKHGLTKLEQPLKRRCNQPFKHVATKYDGQYVLCCVDFLGESKHRYPNLRDGVEGFKRFWFGDEMQWVRKKLRDGDRAGVSECARCDIVFGRADIVWPAEAMRQYWDGSGWRPLE